MKGETTEIERATPKVDTKEMKRATVDIPEAAKMLGISRNSGYAAAKRGDIKVIEMGGRLLVPLAWLNRVLAGE